MVTGNLLNCITDACVFIEKLSSKKICIVYHDDCDGVSSAALLVKYLSKDNDIETVSVRNAPSITEDLMSIILSKKPDVVIIADFAGGIDISAKTFSENGIFTLVLDHHVPGIYLFHEDVIYSNPRLENLSMPASSYIYEILSNIINMDEYLWIAAAGTIADFGASERPDLVKACIKRYPDLFEYDGLDNSKLFDTSFGLIPNSVSYATVWGGYKGAEFALKCMLSCNTPYEFISKKNDDLKKLFENYTDVESEILKNVDLFRKQHKTQGKVKYMVIESGYQIKSIISTIVSPKETAYVFIVIQEKGNEMSMSLRNQSGDYNLNNIIQLASKDIDAHGGGHPKASGAVVSKKDYGTFLENLLNLING
ncbi:MAG: hypothetical protein K0B02_01260 [DPANN group archaeon]|nr:hypothetical protein [DPANN group archaeon]